MDSSSDTTQPPNNRRPMTRSTSKHYSTSNRESNDSLSTSIIGESSISSRLHQNISTRERHPSNRHHNNNYIDDFQENIPTNPLPYPHNIARFNRNTRSEIQHEYANEIFHLNFNRSDFDINNRNRRRGISTTAATNYSNTSNSQAPISNRVPVLSTRYYDSASNSRRNYSNNLSYLSDSDAHVVFGSPHVGFSRSPPPRPNRQTRLAPTFRYDISPISPRPRNRHIQPTVRIPDVYILDSSDDSEIENYPIFEQNDPDSVIINSTERFVPRHGNFFQDYISTLTNPNEIGTENFGLPPIRFGHIDRYSDNNRVGHERYLENESIDDIVERIERYGFGDPLVRSRLNRFVPNRRRRNRNHHRGLDMLHVMLEMNGFVSTNHTPDVTITNDNLAPTFSYPNRKGLSYRIIQSLPTYPFIDISNEYQNESCGICLEKYRNSCIILQMYPCKHIFHKSCIIQWLKVESSCPFCRSRIIEPPIVL